MVARWFGAFHVKKTILSLTCLSIFLVWAKNRVSNLSKEKSWKINIESRILRTSLTTTKNQQLLLILKFSWQLHFFRFDKFTQLFFCTVGLSASSHISMKKKSYHCKCLRVCNCILDDVTWMLRDTLTTGFFMTWNCCWIIDKHLSFLIALKGQEVVV